MFIAGLDKSGYQVNIFHIFPLKHMLWYSIEAPHGGASNEYPQHMFSWRKKENIITFGLAKSSLSKAMHMVHGEIRKLSGPSCSKLTMSLVKVLLKLRSSNIAYRLIFLLKKCE